MFRNDFIYFIRHFTIYFYCFLLFPVSKRLESLGALTHADRRATETRNLSQFNVDNKYGRDALQTVLRHYLPSNNSSAELTVHDFDGDGEKFETYHKMKEAIDDVGLERPIEKVDISRFLNRILGMPVQLQNHLFEQFMDTMENVIERAKKSGKFEMGIMGKRKNILSHFN